MRKVYKSETPWAQEVYCFMRAELGCHHGALQYRSPKPHLAMSMPSRISGIASQITSG